MNKSTQLLLANLGFGALALLFLFFIVFAIAAGSTALVIVLAILLLALLAAWIFADMELLKPKSAEPETAPEMNTPQEISKTFASLLPKAFGSEIQICQKQLARLEEKVNTMDSILRKAFADSNISYNKFMRGVKEAEAIFLENQRQIVHRILLFDEEGYKQAVKKGTVPISYNDAKAFIQQKIEDNEQILEKIDALAAQLTNLDSAPKLEDLSAMRQLDELIQQTNYYKQNVH